MKNGQSDIDSQEVEQVREIMTSFANAVSAMKIFPSDHPTVKKFSSDMRAKLQAFLGTNERLEIGVEEFAFAYFGRRVYRDETTVKSLPFFFFKDGMQTLFFFQGIESEEIMEFLELIKREFLKPADEGDIVNALWERDLAHIQYYAPDDFLEIKILEEQPELTPEHGLSAEEAAKLLDFHVDMTELTTGNIHLSSEDMETISSPTANREKTQDGILLPISEPACATDGDDTGFSASDAHELADLLNANRTISPEEEYLNLMTEIIYLGNDAEKISNNLDMLYEFHFDQIQNGNFRLSVLMIKKLQEMKPSFHESSPEIAKLIESFLKKVTDENTLRMIREFFEKQTSIDYESLLELLKILGTPAMAVIADLYESREAQEFRSRALDYFWGLGMKDAVLISELANDSRPALTMEIIRILRRSSDKRAVSCLATFLRFSNRNLKHEAIRALGDIGDETAKKILMGFLADPDESLRIEAALHLNLRGVENSRVQNIFKMIRQKSFRKKNFAEKRAFLKLLGTSQTEEAFKFLRTTLLSPSLRLRPRRHLEMRLGSVSGLEAMATPEALEALGKGAVARNRAVREASLSARRRLSEPSLPENLGERKL